MKPNKYTQYYSGTKKIYREWYKLNGKRHREDGPAVIYYYENGNIKIEYYYINGNSHRENGPADIWYYENGSIKCEYYFINGKQLTKEQFDKYIRRKQMKELDKLIEKEFSWHL